MTHKTRARILTLAFLGFIGFAIFGFIANALPNPNPRKAECDRQFGRETSEAESCRFMVGLEDQQAKERERLARAYREIAR